jgi:hypothetical protein
VEIRPVQKRPRHTSAGSITAAADRDDEKPLVAKLSRASAARAKSATAVRSREPPAAAATEAHAEAEEPLRRFNSLLDDFFLAADALPSSQCKLSRSRFRVIFCVS